MTVTEAPSISTHAAQTSRRRTFWALIFNILCVATAEIFLKIGASDTAGSASLFGVSALHSFSTIAGIAFHISAFVFWIYALRTVPLALAFNFTALNHVLVPISARIILHEQISMMRWGGIVLVTLGFLLLVPVLAEAEEKTEASL